MNQQELKNRIEELKEKHVNDRWHMTGCKVSAQIECLEQLYDDLYGN